MTEARALLESGGELSDAKADISERLVQLSRRDDLTSSGCQVGPTDALNCGYLLWGEPPHFAQVLVRLDEPYNSPIHEHNNLSSGDTLELIFSAVPPVPATKRFLYDLDSASCRPSTFEISDLLLGDYYPPSPVSAAVPV